MPDPFVGNRVFLENNQAVLPEGPALSRLLAGNFGPSPNDSAPPGFFIAPQASGSPLADALRVAIPPTPPPAPQTPLPSAQGQNFPIGIGAGGLGGGLAGSGLGLGFGAGFNDPGADLFGLLGSDLAGLLGLTGFGFGTEGAVGADAGPGSGGDSEGGGFF
jgi:hypothetical protein